jgi:hypothetical protein
MRPHGVDNMSRSVWQDLESRTAHTRTSGGTHMSYWKRITVTISVSMQDTVLHVSHPACFGKEAALLGR